MPARRCWKLRCVLAVGGLVGVLGCAQAQVVVPFVPEMVSSSGAGFSYQLPNGGIDVKVDQDEAALRPVAPSASEFSLRLEYERWDGDGNRVADGKRWTTIGSYIWGLENNAEVALSVPWQGLDLDNVAGDDSGLNDVEIAYRKYMSNVRNPRDVVWVYSLNAFVPTGDYNKGLGVGKLSGGASLSLSRRFGSEGRSIGYIGGGYNFIGQPDDAVADLENTPYFWIGGMAPLGSKLYAQYDLLRYHSVNDEEYTRALLGFRWMLTPSTALQLNLKRELQADGDASGMSLGYCVRY